MLSCCVVHLLAMLSLVSSHLIAPGEVTSRECVSTNSTLFAGLHLEQACLGSRFGFFARQGVAETLRGQL